MSGTPPFVYPVRIGDSSGALLTGSLALLLGPGLTASYDPDVVCTGDGASITGAVRVELTPPLPIFDPVTTTNATSTPIATLPDVPVGGSMYATAIIEAIVAPGTTYANRFGGAWAVSLTSKRIGSAAPAASSSGGASAAPPFVAAFTGGATPGNPTGGVVSNAVRISVTGFAIKEAWTTGHTYVAGDGSTTPGDFVTNAGGIYLCTTGGVAGASAPTGTGTGISDGTDVWAYVGPADGSKVSVRWTFRLTALVFAS